MKTFKIYGALLAGALTLGAQAQQQQQQQPANDNNASSSRNLPPGLERRDQLPPGLNKRENLPPGLQNRQSSSSDVQSDVAQPPTDVVEPQTGYGTNRFNTSFTNASNASGGLGSNMARFGTNMYMGASNAWTSLSNRFRANQPTGGGTNRVYGSNYNAAAASSTVVRHDETFTAADRKLLVNLRQEVQPILVTAGSAADVHFILREGVVTLVGVVPTVQESQRIVEVVQQTPGVVRVINQIQVNSQSNVNVGATTTTDQGDIAVTMDQFQRTNSTALGSVQTNRGGTSYVGQATTGATNTNTFSAGTGATNSLNTSTNLSPTGRTNTGERMYSNTNRYQNLPPGLQKRDTLPPGLEKRNELPPGLQKREQSSEREQGDQSSR